MPGITDTLSHWLKSDAVRTIGEVAVWNTGSGYRLCHHSDLPTLGPESHSPPTHHRPIDARQLAKLDTAAKFRPLKSAPTLASGWLLELSSIDDVREALDYLYPAAIGLWIRKNEGKILPTHLRDTLNRQTGMYRVTGLIRDEEAAALVRESCAPENCTRKILWDISANLPLLLVREKRLEQAAETENIPLLCCEACNLLVAAARGVVKKRMAKEADTPA
ncbi:MAG: sirohydrochlorin cobaltochelatase [Verrucomicrobiales bacterium]|jgi:sirohydrochlorin cobaltochelatase